jgi:hypothetical protein
MEIHKGIKPVHFRLGDISYLGTLYLIEDDTSWHGMATILGCTQKELERHTTIAVHLKDGHTGLGAVVNGTIKDESQEGAPRISVSLLGSGKLMGDT